MRKPPDPAHHSVIGAYYAGAQTVVQHAQLCSTDHDMAAIIAVAINSTPSISG